MTSILDEHVEAGLQHLLTEDVIRFATIRSLVNLGVDPARLAVERRVPEISASLDLVVDTPPTAVLELKYPRDPEGQGAADTMTFGELLRDLYRLAWIDLDETYALQVFEPRLRAFISRRVEIDWTWQTGESIHLPAGLPSTLPVTAQRSLPAWTSDMPVTATVTYADTAGDLTLVAYQVALDMT